MDGFWEKCEKIVREGQKSDKNLSKKSRESSTNWRVRMYRCFGKKQTKNKKVRRLYRSSA